MNNMNIFDFKRYEWYNYMEKKMENVNLNEIIVTKKDSISFIFSNSYNGAFYKKLICDNVLIYTIENDVIVKSEFSYFVGDVFLRKLSIEELKSALHYYHFGYNLSQSILENQYLLSIIGNDICIDVLCGEAEFITKLD